MRRARRGWVRSAAAAFALGLGGSAAIGALGLGGSAAIGALGLGLAGCEKLASLAPKPDPFAKPPARALAPLEVEHVYAALETGSDQLEPALADLVARRDHRFVAPLIEALRASQIGILDGKHYNAKVVALERLSGQAFGSDWFAWLRWYQGTSLAPPPDFAAYKARLLGKVDPALSAFFASDAPSRVRIEELVWAGGKVDASDPAPGPAHTAAAEAQLEAGEPVVGIVVGSEARAYPLRWLDWHEVANDQLGGRHIAVVWCGFCASAMAYAADDAGVGAGPEAPAPRTFAGSGLVQRGVRLMYDHQTKTLWNELTGEPAVGAGARPNTRLEPLPALLTRWGDWQERHPETSALVVGAPERAETAASPYGRYHLSDETVFPVALARSELPAKTKVYALEAGLRAKAWPLAALAKERVVRDEVGGHTVLLVATRAPIEIDLGGGMLSSPGAEVRAYVAPNAHLRAGPDADTLLDRDGKPWRATDAELLGPDGERSPRLPGTVTYWFAWQAFRPESEVGDGAK